MMRTWFIGAFVLTLVGTSYSEAQAQRATRLKIFPASAVIHGNPKVVFTAVATAADGTMHTPEKLKWSATGGTIDPRGKYATGAKNGYYTATVTAGAFRATARVQIRKPRVRIEVHPEKTTIRPGGKVNFSAGIRLALGKRRSFTPRWSCTGGTIAKDGAYTAGMKHGVFSVSATDPANVEEVRH